MTTPSPASNGVRPAAQEHPRPSRQRGSRLSRERSRSALRLADHRSRSGTTITCAQHQEPQDAGTQHRLNTVAGQELLHRLPPRLVPADVRRHRPGPLPQCHDERTRTPDLFARRDNVIEMRWMLQRELGANLVFFHEVTIPPGTVSRAPTTTSAAEELYYIVARATASPTWGKPMTRRCRTPANGRSAHLRYRPAPHARKCRCGPGQVIFTKSGGIHGIRNPATHRSSSSRSCTTRRSPAAQPSKGTAMQIAHSDAVFRVPPGRRRPTTTPATRCSESWG